MSRKPYVTQDGSPNLVIVPTETYFGQCPKKTKCDASGCNKLQINSKSESALVNKVCVKVSPGTTTRNNNVLIDVSKVTKQQPSWASNFLQSIGGSVKPSRLYHSLGTKYIIPRKGNAQTNVNQSLTNQEIYKPKLNNESTQPKVNNEIIHSKPNNESVRPKLSEELVAQLTTNLKPSQLKDKHVFQANKKAHEQNTVKTEMIRTTRETIQPNRNTETSQPKEKKKPTPKSSEEISHPNTSTDYFQLKAHQKESTHLKSSKEGIQVNTKTKTSHHKSNKEPTKEKNRKETTQQISITGSSLVKANKEAIRSKSKETSRKIKSKGIPQKCKKETTLPKSRHTETNSKQENAIRITQSKESNKKVRHLKTSQSNSKTEKPKAIHNKQATERTVHNETKKGITKKGTVQISPIKPPTTAMSLLKRKDVKLNLNKARVMGKKPKEAQIDNNYTRLHEESPIKSVVTKINKSQNPEYQFNKESDCHVRFSENKCHREADSDLRSKLKRKLPINETNYKNEQTRDHKHHGNKFCTVPKSKGFVPDENLIISFNTESDQAKVKPPTNSKAQSSGGKKCKKIKLEINIIFQNTDTDDESLDNNCKDGNSKDCPENTDLSFLDDFNIDEIVESLNDCQTSKPKIKTDISTKNNIHKTDNNCCDSSIIDSRETEMCSTIQTSHDEFPSLKTCSIQDGATEIKNPDHNSIHLNTSCKINGSDLSKDIQNTAANRNEIQIQNDLVKVIPNEIDQKRNIKDAQKMEVNETNDVETVKKQSNELLSAIKNISFHNQAYTFIAQDQSNQKDIKSFTCAENNAVLNTKKTSTFNKDSKTHQAKILHQNSETQNSTNELPIVVENNSTKKEQQPLDENPMDIELSTDIKTSQSEDDILIIENAKDNYQQCLKKSTTIDLTNNEDISYDALSDDIIFVDTTTPNVIEIDAEPILILDTDYDVGLGLEPSSEEMKSNISPNKKFNSENEIENNLIAEDNNETQKTTKASIIQAKDSIPKTSDVKSQDAPNNPPKPQDNILQAKMKVVECDEAIQRSTNNGFVKNIFVKTLEAELGSKYSITDLVHKGKFSTLYCCEDQNQSKKIIKVLKSSYDSYHLGWCKEDMLIKLQRGVSKDNQNCVLFFKGFELQNEWCFIMEYFPKNLHEALVINEKGFHIDKVQLLSGQLVTAVTILRNNNIIHSDIKPQHILLDESETRLKLCGFDDAFYYCNDNLLPNTGTASYRAPELILGYYAEYKIDVWSTALVMYEMATNKQLFPGHYNNDILYKQQCTLGNVPFDMIHQSYYREMHFMGTRFIRIVGPQGAKRISIVEFIRSNIIRNTLFTAYDREWADSVKAKVASQPVRDKQKLAVFENLLYQMLSIHPRRRLAIEFVFANPFIYELYTAC